MPTSLQTLIADYLRDHPGETYSSIARRGSTPEHELPRSTVHALATREYKRQAPRPETIKALARGLETTEQRVREVAGISAGFGPAETAHDNPEIQLLLSTVRDLDPERMEAVLRRARLLHEEMLEERRSRRRR